MQNEMILIEYEAVRPFCWLIACNKVGLRAWLSTEDQTVWPQMGLQNVQKTTYFILQKDEQSTGQQLLQQKISIANKIGWQKIKQMTQTIFGK